MFGKQKQLGRWIAIAMVTGLVCTSDAWAQKKVKPPPPPSPKLVNLGPGVPTAMNQLDGFVEIVGHNGAGVGRYWMVDSTGALVDSLDLASLPDATDPETWATAINNHGTIVGSQYDETGLRPLVWPMPQSLPVELPVPEGTYWPQAGPINDDGLVLGGWWDDNGQNLVAWKLSISGGNVTVLGRQVILTAPRVWAVGVTNSGYVAYTAEGPSGLDHAFRLMLTWDGLQISEVDGSRSQLFTGSSEATGVNEAGTVSGRYRIGTGLPEAFAMTVSGELLVLPQLPGGKEKGQTYEVRNTCALGLNNASPVQVVGWARKYFPASNKVTDHYDVRITANTSITNLKDEVSNWVNNSVTDINDAGWILGRTTNGAAVLLP